MSELINIYKALADESRLRILRVLLSGPYNVNELVTIVDMGQSRVSRHLKLLLDAGLATVQRQGTWAYYEAAFNGDSVVTPHLQVLQKQEELLRADADEARRQSCLEQRRKRSQEFHDKVAPAWSRLRRELFGNGSATDDILRFIPRNTTVADLGCGAGEILPKLAGKSGRVIGVDSSAAMLDEAQQRLETAQLSQEKQVELRLGTLEHLPLADGEANTALLNMVMHHLADPPAVLREVRRALAANGRLIICELNRHSEEWMREAYGDQWLGFSQNELNRLITQAGLKVVETKEFKDSPRAGIFLTVARVANKGEGQ